MAYVNQTRTGTALGARLNSMLRDLGERYTRYQMFRATMMELNALSERELADLGLHRSNLRSIAYQAAYEN